MKKKTKRHDLPAEDTLIAQMVEPEEQTAYKGRGRPRRSDVRVKDGKLSSEKPNKPFTLKGMDIGDLAQHPIQPAESATIHANLIAHMEFSDVAHPKKREFLSAYGKYGTVLAAVQVAGVSYQTHFNWLHSDDKYPQLFECAKAIFSDRLDDEVFRRAVRGVEQPVFYCGKEVGKIRKYSDILLIFAAKGAMPNKYNTERREISGRGGGNIQVDHKHEHTVNLCYENKEKLLTDIAAEINRRRAIDLETIDTIAREVEQIDEQKALPEPEEAD